MAIFSNSCKIKLTLTFPTAVQILLLTLDLQHSDFFSLER